jgi:hypothetical protein
MISFRDSPAVGPVASLATLAFLATAPSASAATPPQQLFNKTILVSFSIMWSSAPGPLSVQRQIYVSSNGRIFVRGTRSTGRAADSNDVSLGTYRYEGGRIVGYYKLNTGANQITVSFDPSFTTCTAALQFGRPSGESYRGTAPDGVTRTSSTAPTASGVSCSIRDGNPFGQ